MSWTIETLIEVNCPEWTGAGQLIVRSTYLDKEVDVCIYNEHGGLFSSKYFKNIKAAVEFHDKVVKVIKEGHINDLETFFG
jgi:hypothetical protein